MSYCIERAHRGVGDTGGAGVAGDQPLLRRGGMVKGNIPPSRRSLAGGTVLVTERRVQPRYPGRPRGGDTQAFGGNDEGWSIQVENIARLVGQAGPRSGSPTGRR